MNYLKIFQTLNVKDADKWAKSCNDNLSKFGIVNTEDICFFLANVMNESGKFTNLTESLYYTTEVRLAKVFKRAFGVLIYDTTKFIKTYPIYFDNDLKRNCQIQNYKYNPTLYLKNEQKLANLVYDDRIFPNLHLGNTFDNDGFNFRGRGAIQITGRSLYKQVSDLSNIDFISNPNLLASEDYAILGAAIYWKINNISKRATTILQARQIVAGNFSSNPMGYSTVLNYYNLIKKAM